MVLDIDKRGRWFVKYGDQNGVLVRRFFGRGTIARDEAEEFIKRNRSLPDETILLPPSERKSSSKSHLSQGHVRHRNRSVHSEPTMLSIMPTFKSLLVFNGRSKQYVSELERIVKRSGLGHVPLKELSFSDFTHFIEYSDITRNRYLSYIKIVLNYAVSEDLIRNNPLRKWHKQKEQPRRNPLTLEDLEKIKAVAAPHLKWAIEVAQNLGVRCGKTELFSLKWQDVNYEFSYIRVYASKTKTVRDIPFTKEFTEKLKEKQKVAMTPFICEYPDKTRSIVLPMRRIQRSWRTALRNAGLDYHCVFYDVRHLYATTLLNRGADLNTVAALLGHASTKMTADVYGHTCLKSMRSAVELLSKTSERRSSDETQK